MQQTKHTPVYGGFLMLPHALLHCPKFGALSASAVKLLLDIGGQYNGKNNGDLSAAWKIMRTKGWRSETTLNRAKHELLAAGFIAETRKGRLPNICGLYGITWHALNPNPKLDIGSNGFPVGLWAELPKADLKNASLTPETGVVRGSIAPISGVVRLPIAPKSGAMPREKAFS